MFVVTKDFARNILVASETPTAPVPQKSYPITGLQWVSGVQPTGTLTAQYRYHGERIAVELSSREITFSKPVLVAAGQSVVLYDQKGEICMGGAIIG